MMVDFAKFERVIRHRYPDLHKACELGCVIAHDGDHSYDIDDILERNIFPELIPICDEIRRLYLYSGKESVNSYKVIWGKMLQWLRENPDRIAWVCL